MDPRNGLSGHQPASAVIHQKDLILIYLSDIVFHLKTLWMNNRGGSAPAGTLPPRFSRNMLAILLKSDRTIGAAFTTTYHKVMTTHPHLQDYPCVQSEFPVFYPKVKLTKNATFIWINPAKSIIFRFLTNKYPQSNRRGMHIQYQYTTQYIISTATYTALAVINACDVCVWIIDPSQTRKLGMIYCSVQISALKDCTIDQCICPLPLCAAPAGLASGMQSAHICASIEERTHSD